MFKSISVVVFSGVSFVALTGTAFAQQSVTTTLATDDDYLFQKQRLLVSDQRLFRAGVEYTNGPLSFAVDDYGEGPNEETDYTLRYGQTCLGDLQCSASVAFWDTRLEQVADYAISIGGGSDLWWSVGLEFQDGETYQSFIPSAEGGLTWVVPGIDWLSLQASGGIAHDSNSKTTQLIWRAGPTLSGFGLSASAGWYGYVPLDKKIDSATGQKDDGRSSFGISISHTIEF